VRDFVQRTPFGEHFEGHLFHGLANDVVHQRAVVDDLAVAHVDAVMGVAEKGSDEMGAGRWQFAWFQRPDAS
jgi:hypothetical protein